MGVAVVNEVGLDGISGAVVVLEVEVGVEVEVVEDVDAAVLAAGDVVELIAELFAVVDANDVPDDTSQGLGLWTEVI